MGRAEGVAGPLKVDWACALRVGAGRAGRPSGGGELGPGKEWWAAGLGCWVGLGFWVFWAGFPFQILTLFPISISNKVWIQIKI